MTAATNKPGETRWQRARNRSEVKMTELAIPVADEATNCRGEDEGNERGEQ